MTYLKFVFDISLNFEMPFLTVVDRVGYCHLTCHWELLTSTLNFTLLGIYYEPDCSSKDLDHGVLVIGYGSEGGDPKSNKFWIVKNRYKTPNVIFEIETGTLLESVYGFMSIKAQS